MPRYKEEKMSNNGNNTTVKGGIGFFGLLAIVFITFKLCGVIDWSWWLVLLPLYGPIAAVIALLLIIFVIMTLMDKIEERSQK